MEVVLAMGLVGILLLSLILVLTNSLGLIQRSREIASATALGREFLENVKANSALTLAPPATFDGRIPDARVGVGPSLFPPTPYPAVVSNGNEFHLRVETETIEPGGSALAFLSADSNGSFGVTADGRLSWQKFIIYEWDPGSRQVLRQEILLPAALSSPAPLEACDTGSGPRPLSTYLGQGSVLASPIVLFEAVQRERVVEVTVRSEAQRYGSQRPEVFELVSSTLLRN